MLYVICIHMYEHEVRKGAAKKRTQKNQIDHLPQILRCFVCWVCVRFFFFFVSLGSGDCGVVSLIRSWFVCANDRSSNSGIFVLSFHLPDANELSFFIYVYKYQLWCVDI